MGTADDTLSTSDVADPDRQITIRRMLTLTASCAIYVAAALQIGWALATLAALFVVVQAYGWRQALWPVPGSGNGFFWCLVAATLLVLPVVIWCLIVAMADSRPWWLFLPPI